MEKTYTLEEAHAYFGVTFNNAIFPLLEKENRTIEEDMQLLDLAHAAMLHWKNNPKHSQVNIQRAQYMLACAYTFTKYENLAVFYAESCIKTTEAYASEMEDFDVAYAHLALARAYALANNEGAARIKQQAIEFGKKLKDKEGQKYFFADMEVGPWFGIG